MNKKVLSFEKIFPYVRHVHLSGIESYNQSVFLKSFDCRLFYIYDGKGYYIVNGHKYHVSRGNLLLWQPGTEYFIYSSPSHHLVIIGINFDFTNDNLRFNYPIAPVKSKNFNPKKIIELVHFTDTEIFNRPVFIKDFKSYENILLEINNEYVVKKKYYNQRIRGLLLSVIGIIARSAATSNLTSNQSHNSIDNILDFIHENYALRISNAEIGKKLNFHPNYINRLMVLHTGKSLHQYLLNYRISKAISLMQTTEKSISEIAYSVGYKNINYFSKAFKNRTGQSPRKFREQYKGLLSL